MVIYNPDPPELGEQGENDPQYEQMALVERSTDSVFPSSPPQKSAEINSNIDFPQLPKLKNIHGPLQNLMNNYSSSDPLSGPSNINKRQASVSHYQTAIHEEPLNKKRVTIHEDLPDVEDDNMSDIIANAPRLNSSRYASLGPESQNQANVGSNNPQIPTHVNETYQQSSSPTVKEELFIARDHIVRAYYATPDRNEQSRLLDLLEIFREYTERGFIKKASNIIASQVANLETATRQIESKTRDLKKSVNPATPVISSKPISMAAIAGNGVAHGTDPLEWTLVGTNGKPQPKSKQSTNPPVPVNKPKTVRRVILVQAPESPPLDSPITVRNRINHAFAKSNINGPVVRAVAKTSNKNIVITTTEEYNADFLIEKKEIWQGLVPFVAMQKDQTWFKVVAHGVPLADFDHDQGMEMMIDEVTTFNKGLKPIGTPYWISTIENRKVNRAGSVAIAFATEEEANRAVRNRLYIAGISVRVTKYYNVALSTQCLKCQGFGHLDTYCRRDAKCGLCGENHSTQQHYCSFCKVKGKSCAHLAPKCANCQGPHQSNNKSCEIFLATKNRNDDTVL